MFWEGIKLEVMKCNVPGVLKKLEGTLFQFNHIFFDRQVTALVWSIQSMKNRRTKAYLNIALTCHWAQYNVDK